MEKIYVGIDNGVSGSISILSPNKNIMLKTPVILMQNYTKTKQNINRLNAAQFLNIFQELKIKFPQENLLIIFERPLVNPTRFKATLSAIRCLEAQLIIIESLQLPYMYIDSKQWQKELLPQGCKGTNQLKKASYDIGLRLFPNQSKIIKKQKDADSLLIAEYARRKNL